MDQKDQDDIINKVKEAGNDDNQDNNKDDKDDNQNNSSDDNAGGADGDSVSSDFGGEQNGGNQGGGEQGGEVSEGKEGFFIKPKKLSIFAPEGSEEANFKHEKVNENLINQKKNSIFVKNNIKLKLKETFKQEDMDDSIAEPMVTPEPTTKPNVVPTTKPNTAPSRKNKPFLPMPNVQPDPKAKG